MRSDEASLRIAKLVEGIPEWLRQDLIARDPTVRARAEETLSAMIATALKLSKD